MINLITGVFAFILVCVFLGYYAISLNSAPLWVIIGAVLVMVTVDVVQSIRGADDEQKKNDD